MSLLLNEQIEKMTKIMGNHLVWTFRSFECPNQYLYKVMAYRHCVVTHFYKSQKLITLEKDVDA